MGRCWPPSKLRGMSDLSTRLAAFEKSIAEFKAESHPSWQTGTLYNALLAMTKEAHADDPVIRSLQPASRATTVPGAMGKEISNMDAGSMRAAVNQMLSVVGRRGPSIG